MPKVFEFKLGRLEWILFFLILVLAAALRLGWPDNVAFSADQAAIAWPTLDLVHGRSFPLLGARTSVGFPATPMSNYVMAVPYALSSNSVIATGYVALLSVIAVGMVYGLARRYYGPQAAVIAGILYAVNPFAVYYARRIWQPSLLPLFVVVAIGTGLLGFVEGKRWAQLLFMPLMVIAGQIHYAAAALIPIPIILLIVGRRKIRREFLYSLVLAVLVTLPYVVGLMQTSVLSADNLHKTVLGGAASGVTLTRAAVHETVIGIAGRVPGTEGGFDYLFDTLPVAAAAAALWLLYKVIWRRSERWPIDLVLLVWLTGTALLFSVTWASVYMHYMVGMLPSGCLVIGAAVGDLLQQPARQRLPRIALAASGITFAVVVIAQMYVATAATIAETAGNGDFGVPLGYYMTIRQAILDKLPGKVVVFAPEVGLWNVLLYDLPGAQIRPDGPDVYEPEKVIYLSHKCSGAVQTFTLPNNPICYALSWRGPSDLNLSDYTLANQSDLTFATGAHILAYQWQPQSGCLTLVWKVGAPHLPPAEPGYMGKDYLFSLRFYNADKTKIVPLDVIGWQGASLSVGDLATDSFCLPADQQPASDIAGVRVGMYIMGGAQAYAADLFDPNHQYAGKKKLDIPFVPNVHGEELI